MMQMHVFQVPEEEEQEQEGENFKRRISRPKIQYSPVPEIKKRIMKKPKFNLKKMTLQRLNSGQIRNHSSASAYSSRENSSYPEDEEEEFQGFDILSQNELRDQLEKIKCSDFSLPYYSDLLPRIENDDFQSQNRDKYLPDNLLDDEQEEIRLLETNRSVADQYLGQSIQPVFPAENNNNISISNELIELIENTGGKSQTNQQIEFTTNVPEPALNFTRTNKSESTTPSKRIRRQKQPEDYIYTPLIKQKPDSVKLTKQKTIQIKKPTHLKMKIKRMKLPKKHSNIAETSRSDASIITVQTAAPSQAQVAQEQPIAIAQDVFPSTSSDLSIKEAEPTTSNKRMRKPKVPEDYAYKPLFRQQNALKLKQKALKIKQPTHLKVGRPIGRPRKHIFVSEESYLKPAHEEKSPEKPVVRIPKLMTLSKKVAVKPLTEIPTVQMEFFERMSQRKKLNPFSIGINKSDQFPVDYFYREIFVSEDEPMDENSEEEIDCVGVPKLKLEQDELITSNPADEIASAIHEVFTKGQTEISSINLEEQSEDAFEDILRERVNATEQSTKEFLVILLKFIIEQRHVDIVTQGITGGASMFHSLTMKNANRLRESLKLYSKSMQDTIILAHCWLLKNLPKCFIASYLNLLRFLKTAGSNLTDHIIESAQDEYIIQANSLVREFVAQKIYEPPMNPSFNPVETGPIPNVSLVLVYPQITTTTCKHIIRAHETLFRQLLPLVVCCVEKVELNFDTDKPLTIEQCAWMSINLIRRRVREIVKRRPNDHIFLAGWGTTCWINHKVAMNVSGVSGILNFAFPTESACGSRGSVDDEICLTYPSTLFIVGEDAANVNMNAMKRLRRNMIADTGLIVIGAANQNLLVSQTRLAIERVTQFVVQRTIVEYAVQFMKQVVTDLGSPRECREYLKPVKLPSLYEVDATFLKGAPPQAKRKPTEKKLTSSMKPPQLISSEPSTSAAAGFSKTYARPTKMASHLPPNLQPAIPTSSTRCGITTYQARTSFTHSLKGTAAKAPTADVAATAIKIPSPEELNRQFQQAASIAVPSTSAATNTFQDSLREEEEAAAALALLK